MRTFRGETTIDQLRAELGQAQYGVAQMRRREKAHEHVDSSELRALVRELERLTELARECAADHESREQVARRSA